VVVVRRIGAGLFALVVDVIAVVVQLWSFVIVRHNASSRIIAPTPCGRSRVKLATIAPSSARTKHEDRMSREYPSAPLLAVGVVVLSAGEVLLIKRGRPPGAGLYSVPGGKVRLGETLAEAAARELYEECGLVAEIGPLVEVVERVTRDEAGRIQFHYVIADFVAQIPAEQKASARAADDAAEVLWIDPAKLGTLATTEGLAPVIEKAFRLCGEPRPRA
jgi:ADP-ribose pyrophosphatase YjhB (NUDIX family)